MLTAPQSILVSTETLFGTGEGQIPEGSIITQATVEVADEGDASEIKSDSVIRAGISWRQLHTGAT